MSTYPASLPTRNYDQLVETYDLLATCWSGSAIRAARMWCASQIAPDERVLIVGPGTGEDAARMAKIGADLLLVDYSIQMLGKSIGRCRDCTNKTPDKIHGDFRTQKNLPNQDTVVAPFFLNVFSRDEALEVLRQMRSLIDANGRILISDFSPPPKKKLERFAMELWHGIPMAFFHIYTGNAWHRVHDIPKLAEKAELTIATRKKFSLTKWGPHWTEALELRKRSSS